MTPLLTEATDWGSHVRLLPHHLVSLGSSVSLAKAVIKGAADYSAVPPGTLTDWLLCHQQHSVVGFLLFNPLLWGGIVFLYISAPRCVSPQGTQPVCECTQREHYIQASKCKTVIADTN